jgi:Cdc6-like AAA superfamily ATPase
MRAGIISRPEVFEEDFLPDVMPFRDSQVKELASRMPTFTVTANTCNLLGSGSKDYKLVYPLFRAMNLPSVTLASAPIRLLETT